MQFPELWTDNCADLLRAFNNQGVQYLLIGSMAKSHYCRQPRVNDIDLITAVRLKLEQNQLVGVSD